MKPDVTLRPHFEEVRYMYIFGGELWSSGFNDTIQVTDTNLQSTNALNYVNITGSSVIVNKEYIVYRSSNNRLYIFKIGTNVAIIKYIGYDISTMSSYKDGIIIASHNSTLQLIGLEDLTKSTVNNDNPIMITHINHRIWEMTAADNIICCALANNNIEIWNTDNNSCITLCGHKKWITCLVIHKHVLWSSSSDNTIRRWDITNNGECLQVIQDHKGYTRALNEWRNGVCSGSWDQTVIIWNSNGVKLRSISVESLVMSIIVHDKDIYVGAMGGNIMLYKNAIIEVDTLKDICSRVIIKYNIPFYGIRESFNTLIEPILPQELVDLLETYKV